MSIHEKELKISQALTVCAELTGTQLSDAAFDVMLEDLLAYDTEQVLAALNRCRRELTGRLTLAAVLDRLDTGFPSADEAFGLLAEGWANENLTVVVPEIALLAAGDGAAQLWNAGDRIGARMAFREAYVRRQANERAAGKVARWSVSAGNDREQRIAAIMAAVKRGRLPESAAAAYLPSEAAEERLLLETGQTLSLEDKTRASKHTAAILAMLNEKMAVPQGAAA